MPQSVKFSLEMRFVQLVFFCALAICGGSAKEDEGVSAGTVIREINIAQKNPPLYATYVRELRSRYDGGSVVLPGGMKWRMKEGSSVDRGDCALPARS